ncbi:HNH endonuclease [Brachybacterium phenoliresistens]|uniref:HNH endonuclease n=1 Tax=Brachybacterium phenoliresistens TaxID=396014 RepID=UPI0031E41DAF
MASSTQHIRSGRGHRTYRRQRDILANRYRRNGWPCPECGRPFDWANPQSAQGFTADHPRALATGGKLIGQQLVAMCRGCNARKGATVMPVITPATLPEGDQTP